MIGIYEHPDSNLENWHTLIYKHHDGYIEGVLPILIPLLIEFDKKRSLTNTEYLSAYIVARLKGDRFTAVGIAKDLHADIEFFYAVFEDRVEVFEVEYDIDFEAERILTQHKPSEWKKLKTISLKNVPKKYRHPPKRDPNEMTEEKMVNKMVETLEKHGKKAEKIVRIFKKNEPIFYHKNDCQCKECIEKRKKAK